MAETICNTSPIQYLHQLDHLDLLKQLCGYIIVPPAVVDELAIGAPGFNARRVAADLNAWTMVANEPDGTLWGRMVVDFDGLIVGAHVGAQRAAPRRSTHPQRSRLLGR